jgi:hypothetical protein
MLYIHYFALETVKSLNFYKIHLVFCLQKFIIVLHDSSVITW